MSCSTDKNWTWNIVDNSCSLRSPELQLTVELENGRSKCSGWHWSKIAFEINTFSFLMNNSDSKEHIEKQEQVTRRNEVKEEDPWSRKLKLNHRQCKVLTLGLDQINKFIYRLDGPLGEWNV
jgi:hypothetical protein